MGEGKIFRWDIAKILISTFLYGLGNTATKLLYQLYPDVQPIDISCLRFIITTALLFLVCAYNRHYSFRFAGRDLPLFFAMGAGLALCVLCILSAVTYISVGAASFTQSTSTLLICVLSVVLFQERISALKLLGLVAGFAGLITMFFSPNMASTGNAALVGYGIALLSAIGKVLYILSCKKLRQNYEAIPVVMYCTLIASFLLLPIARPWRIYVQYGGEPMLHILVILTSVVCSGIAYILYFSALKTVSASTAGILNTVEPVSSTLTTLLILGEVFTLRQGIGCALILAGVVITQLNYKAPGSAMKGGSPDTATHFPHHHMKSR